MSGCAAIARLGCGFPGTVRHGFRSGFLVRFEVRPGLGACSIRRARGTRRAAASAIARSVSGSRLVYASAVLIVSVPEHLPDDGRAGGHGETTEAQGAGGSPYSQRSWNGYRSR